MSWALHEKEKILMQSFKSFIKYGKNKESEQHNILIQRKYYKFLVRFTKEPHSNPNIDRMEYFMSGFDYDESNGRLTPNFDDRYSKFYKDEKSWRAAIKRMKRKEVNS